ncbi:hypothetical protein [Actinoplanes sp. NPDC051851]|uniref:hypothetical protein n=1 Tax=Actinoplanes sp. NPDC051851 TaxID=3154753 RepID=UPI003446DFF2
MPRNHRETPMERALHSRAASHARWSREADRTAATAPARAGLQARFERQVDPDGVLPLPERARRAESARKAYYADLTRKSIAARRRKREQAA